MTEPTAIYSEIAERAVLGSILIDGELIKIIDLLPDEFFIKRYAVIYKAMKAVDKRNGMVDLLSVHQELVDRKIDVGGIGVISDILANTHTAANFEYHCEVVREKANRRRAVSVAQNMVNAAVDESKPFITGEYITALMDTERGAARTYTLKDGVTSFEKWISERVELRAGGQLDKLPKTNIPELDDILIYLEPGQQTVIAGEPGVGKTMLAQQIIESNTASKRMIFSMEMSMDRLVARMVSAKSGVKVSAMRMGLPGDDGFDLQKIRNTYAMIERQGLFLNCSTRLTVEAMYSEIAKKQAQGHDISLVVIDYFGLIHEPGNFENNTIREQAISGKLQRMFKELNVHGLIIDTYNKAGFGGGGKMGNIGGTARKSYDADNVITLTLGDNVLDGQQIWLDVVKSRDGENGKKQIGLMRKKGIPLLTQMTTNEYNNAINKQ